MKLVFVGADHEVTGSCHYLEVAGKHILVDYGMEQGVNVFENVPLPVAESMIDYVFLTHAHVDHSGLLPLLYARDIWFLTVLESKMSKCTVSFCHSMHVFFTFVCTALLIEGIHNLSSQLVSQ